MTAPSGESWNQNAHPSFSSSSNRLLLLLHSCKQENQPNQVQVETMILESLLRWEDTSWGFRSALISVEEKNHLEILGATHRVPGWCEQWQRAVNYGGQSETWTGWVSSSRGWPRRQKAAICGLWRPHQSPLDPPLRCPPPPAPPQIFLHATQAYDAQ